MRAVTPTGDVRADRIARDNTQEWMCQPLLARLAAGFPFFLHGVRYEVAFVSKATVRSAACEGGNAECSTPAFIKLINNGSVLLVDDDGVPLTSISSRSLDRLTDAQTRNAPAMQIRQCGTVRVRP
jgi:hypothetical protein